VLIRFSLDGHFSLVTLSFQLRRLIGQTSSEQFVLTNRKRCYKTINCSCKEFNRLTMIGNLVDVTCDHMLASLQWLQTNQITGNI